MTLFRRSRRHRGHSRSDRRAQPRRWARTAVAVTTVAGLALTACGGDGGDGGDEQTFEFFSWWTGGGDSEGKQALLDLFQEQNPDVEIVDSAVAGGAGSNAQAELANRLSQGDPPDSYQRHAGRELLDDTDAGYLEELNSLYEDEGWEDVFPETLLELIRVDGNYYSVPVNVHRSNVLWYNPEVLERAGIDAPPTTWDEFLTQAETLEAEGITPLTIGPLWTQEHLLENVLLGELGPEAYNGLWDGSTDWESPEVIAALEMFSQVLEHSNLDSAASDWQPAIDPIIEGDAAYNVMGDWADTYFRVEHELEWETEYHATTSPGTEGVFNFLSDTFTLPVDAPHRGIALDWLRLAGSQEGQDTFNPVKGSIPARTDGDASLYTGYLEIPFQDWTNPDTTIVGSLAHGVVASNAWKGEIESALQQFVEGGSAEDFAAAVTEASDV
jgi:glucose/mannose transport system substrate-binding protein